MNTVIVGAGIGGLAAAVRLAAAGHAVTVVERNPVVGGKVTALELDGYRFDLGAPVLTLPHVFDDLFRLAGTSLAGELDVVRVDPHVRCRWPDTSTLTVRDGEVEWLAELERFSPGAAAEWARFASRAEQTWDAYEATMLRRATQPRSLLARVRSAADGALDGRRSLAKLADECFHDQRLRQFVNRYASHSGSLPRLVPATAAGLVHAERAFGRWHVTGGIARLPIALADAARRMGVDIRCGVDVGRVRGERGSVRGVELADGGVIDAQAVIVNADAAHLYTELWPDTLRAKALDRVRRSLSGFLVCAGVRGRTEGIAHHNLFFSLDDVIEHRYLESGNLPLDPTVYACVSSVTDRSMAPRDGENWHIFVSVPAALGVDRKVMTAAALNRLAERGADLRDRVEFTRTLLPADFDVRYRARGGALYGSSCDGREAMFERPSNVGPIDGLYLVGSSTRPGGGMPFAAISAQLVTDRIAAG